MKYCDVLNVKNRTEFRAWLTENCDTAKECFVELKRGKPTDDRHFWYLDAVEEAICFGWVDSTLRNIDGESVQRFSPRRSKSRWTRLNIERALRLQSMGLMTDAGISAMPQDTRFVFDEDVAADLMDAGAWDAFCALPELYIRIRGDNLSSYKHINEPAYRRMLLHTVATSKQGKTFGEWNDYGRLK